MTARTLISIAVQGFEHEPPQIDIELIEIDDLLEGRPRTKIARGRIFEGDEIRAQTVIPDSLQPQQRTGPVGASRGRDGSINRLDLRKEDEACCISSEKEKPADLSFTCFQGEAWRVCHQLTV